MDENRNDPARHQSGSHREGWWHESYRSHEIAALIVGGLSLMVLLALFSFHPGQLPSWARFGLSLDLPQESSNFVGPVGAVTAGYLLFLCGVASYLIPATLVLWAVQVFATKRRFGVRNFIALTVLLFSSACLADCQPVFFRNWVASYHLPQSPGGIVGSMVGDSVFVSLFGPAGTFIIMSIVTILALVVVTGIHPVLFTRRLIRSVHDCLQAVNWEKHWNQWSGMQPHHQEASLYPQRSLPVPNIITIDPEFTDHFHRDPRTFGGAVEPEMEEEEWPEENEEILNPSGREIPRPRIIDATGRPSSASVSENRPSREEVRQMVEAASLLHQGETGGGAGGDFRKPLYESRCGNYQLPSLNLLNRSGEMEGVPVDDETLLIIQHLIVDTLSSFSVDVAPGDITKGPTITRFEFHPSKGLRVNKIVALRDDIARATRAERINILAPIPGKDTVGIEIANSNKITVTVRELLESEEFACSSSRLPLCLGKDVYGQAIIGDLTKMPHLLVAGATGSGKSVCVNSIIASLLYRFSPDDLKFIMIDPKVVEMQIYNELPHMIMPVVTDPKKVQQALRWVIKEMEDRYLMFARKGVRSFESFNSLRAREESSLRSAREKLLQPNLINTETGEDFLDDSGHFRPFGGSGCEDVPAKLPYIVVIIDELADLMQTADADVETSIARIAQKARAAGIHLIIATQTPRAEVITGVIKANIPCRIAFQVSSKTDSRIILDENGAENLIGKGDMLYLPPRSAKHIRAQGALITDEEALALVKACAAQAQPHFAEGFAETDAFGDEDFKVTDADEEVLAKCMEVIFTEGKASTSMLQRKLRLGYTRAARMMDILESRGIVGPGEGAKPREILVDFSKPE